MVLVNPWRSLKTRVTLITSTLLLLSLWVLTLAVSTWHLQDQRELLGVHQFVAASIVADQISLQIDDRIRALEAVAKQIPPEKLAREEGLQQELDSRPVLGVLFNAGSYITGLNGTALASVPPSIPRVGLNFLGRKNVRSALYDGVTSIGDIVVGTALNVPLYSIAVAIRNTRQEVVGSLVGVVDLTQANFLDKINDRREGQFGGYFLLARSQRLIVAATDKARIMEELAGYGVNPQIDRFLDGWDGWQILKGPAGVESLIAAKQIPIADWVLAAATPTSKAFQSVMDLQQQLLWMTIVLTFLTGTVNWLILKRQLSPLVATIKTLSELSESSQPIPALTVTRRDEIGDLIESFNRLLRALEKRAEERARYEALYSQNQRLEALGLLAGGIAHDFNNLLAGIFGNLELALLKDKGGPAVPYLTKTLDTLGRARNLSQQLMTFSKGGTPDLRTGKLFPFVEETARFALSGSPVSCKVEVPADLWLCRFDRHQLGQVIENLVINAVQAMPTGGSLFLRAENVQDAGCWVRLTFTDTGEGMPSEVLSHVFEPFFTTKSLGHGLGLSTSHSIVRRHGGTLSVTSERGKGTSFSIVLPAATEGEMEPETEPGQDLERQHHGYGTVLIMDDEPVLGEILEELLMTLGYPVLRTSTGEEAVAAFRKDRAEGRVISAAILDLTVPGGMGGVETLALLHQQDPTLPALVASGFSEAPVLADPQAYGFTAAIRKPYLRAELEAALEGLFGTGEDTTPPRGV